MAGNDPYTGGTWAGTKNRSSSTVGTNTYVEFAPYNTARVAMTIQNVSANNIQVRLGPVGQPEFTIVPTGSFSRSNRLGGCPAHSIWLRSAAGGDAFTFEEN